MLDDGFTYNAIVSKLEQLGYPGFLQQNISRWTKGGYQTWLKEQRFQAVLALLDKGNSKTEAPPRAFDPPALTAAHTETTLPQTDNLFDNPIAVDSGK